jgi:hypothetical protein
MCGVLRYAEARGGITSPIGAGRSPLFLMRPCQPQNRTTWQRPPSALSTGSIDGGGRLNVRSSYPQNLAQRRLPPAFTPNNTAHYPSVDRPF